jgi:NAD(P)-dependent dehydrogenase (short-subunit alcohol dehydrogenase family)
MQLEQRVTVVTRGVSGNDAAAALAFALEGARVVDSGRCL